jgi:hypothetical protein
MIFTKHTGGFSVSYRITIDASTEKLSQLMSVWADGVEDKLALGEAQDCDLMVLHEYRGNPTGVWVKGHHLSDAAMLKLIVDKVYVEAILRGWYEELPDGPLRFEQTQWLEIETGEFYNILLPEVEDPSDVVVDGPFLATVCWSEELGEIAAELL